jgi:hypothetical protein
VIADHAAVILDLDLQEIAPVSQPGQFGRELMSRRIRD